MKLWLDDARLPPPSYSHWARTADECIKFLKEGRCKHVSLDHDLAFEHYVGNKPAKDACKEKTGMAVVDWMIENNVWPREVRIHTMNPVGRENMRRACLNHAPRGRVRCWVELPNDSPGVTRAPWET